MSERPTHSDTWTWSIPDYFNIAAACADRHAQGPRADYAAVIVEDEHKGTLRLSYRELSEASGRFAQTLKNRGIRPGDRVAIRLSNGLEFPIAFFGTLKAGAIAVPTSPFLTENELTHIVSDSGASIVITDQFAWTDTERTTVQEPSHPTRANDPAYLVYTSGTTAHPKGVLHAHRALLGRQPASTYWLNLNASDRVLHTGKLNWTYTLGTGLMDPLYRGATTILWEGKNDPGRWMDLIDKHRATHFITVPTVYRQILSSTPRPNTPSQWSLRRCASAGEALPAEILSAWQSRFGVPIYEGFGMTECSYYLSHGLHSPIRPGSAGRPQPGHAIALLDEQLEPVRDGETGVIAIPEDNPALFLRYWNTEAKDSRQRGWFFTGDIATRDSDGYYTHAGRKDELIKSFGYRVSPLEVEHVLKMHPTVADCAVVGEEVEAAKVLITAYVIPRDGTQVCETDLLAHSAQHLARYKQPKRIHFVHDFPRTQSGKLIRKRLHSH